MRYFTSSENWFLSSDAEILFELNFNQKVVNAKHFIGKGKLEEIKRIIDLNKIELIIFNHNLFSISRRNIESFFKDKSTR